MSFLSRKIITSSPDKLTRKLWFYKISAWINIFCQILFPLSATFTPAIAASTGDKNNVAFSSAATQPYTLAADESVQTVATKLGLTLMQLKDINQYRTFVRGFEQAKPGDEIDIPKQKLAALSARPQSTATPIIFASPEIKTSSSDTQSYDAAANMLRSIATSKATQEIEKWLSQYGTTQVQLNVDPNFSLEGSALDWLLPFYDTPSLTLFNQLGVRNKEQRNTINIGVGARTLQNNWLLGFNAFYDYDLTGNNSRLGTGMEAWTDYLQLSVNSYLRLNNWHQSRDFADYNERPANGFDIRANGWLPTLPQLGGKLVYEKYFGDNVALFGKDNLQQNPHGLTIGINYTPFPLLTFGVDERLGQGGVKDTQVNLQLTYRLGESWLSQISSSAVAMSRLVTEKRYDLVERNNNIVLEYQKQQMMELALSLSEIQGLPGSTHLITTAIKSKYGLSNITLSGESLIAAGGRIASVDKNNFRITLPPYNKHSSTTNNGISENIYSLYAVAFDTKGNQSNNVPLIVKVQQPQATLDGTPLVNNDGAMANGTDKIGVNFFVKDSNGAPVSGQEVNITADNNAKPPQMKVKTNTAGIAQIDLTNTRAGTTTVTATLDGVSKNQKIEFVADRTTSHFSGVPTITNNNAPADGSSKIMLAFGVSDATDNPIVGEDVRFTTNNGAQPAQITIKTNSQGIALLDVTNINVGSVIITATVASDNQSYQVNFVADRASAQITGTPTIMNNNALADGHDKIEMTVEISDAKGNPIPDQLVVFDANNGATPARMDIDTDIQGRARFTATNTRAGTTSIQITVNGKTQTFDVNFEADPSTADFIGTPTIINNGALADGTSKIGVQFILKDGNGNPLTNQEVALSTTNSAMPSKLMAKTDALGAVLIELTNLKAGITTVSAIFNGKSQNQNVQFSIDTTTAHFDGKPVVTNENARADGKTPIGVAFTLKDAQGNPIAGHNVTITSNNSATPQSSTVLTNAHGVARIELTNTVAGVTTVTAKFNGTAQSQNVMFTADLSTAQFVGVPVVNGNNAPANGTAEISVAFTLKDALDNPIVNQNVELTTTHGATPQRVTVKSNDKGIAQILLTNTVVGISSVEATYNGKSQSQDVEFIADITTAQFIGAPVVSNNNALANGTDLITVTFTLQDIHNNPIPNAEITISTNNGAIPDIGTLKTNVQGQIKAQLTNRTAGITQVTASFNGQKQSQNVSFVQPITVKQNIFNRVLALNNAINITPITVYGGSNPVVSISPALPNGLTLDTSSGVISGTPTVLSAEDSYTLSVKDLTNTPAVNVILKLSVVMGPTVTVSVSNKILTQNASVATGSYIPVIGTSPAGEIVSYSVSPALPAGLGLNSTNGAISGTPTVSSGSTTYTMTVRDSKTGATNMADFTLAVANALIVKQSIYNRVLPVDNMITILPITITGGVNPTVTINPALPSGLTINATTGEISGVTKALTTAQVYTLSVTDSNGSPTKTLSLTLSTIQGPNITATIADKTVEQGKPVDYTPITAGAPTGSGPLSYSIQATLPAGLGLNSTNGRITGTPSRITPTETYTMTIRDSKSGAEINKNFSLSVVTAFAYTQTIYNRTIKTGNQVDLEVIKFTGGSGEYTAVIMPELPVGLILSFPAVTPSSLVLSGMTTTTLSQTDYQLIITDSKTGVSATRKLTLTVN
ncbi:TPA: inverse autotransporter beta domain-containing protein [Salmonella enterica subsp. diarizonae serovar 61:l,v:z35]